MTDKEFCRIETLHSGEHIDKVEQLQKATFTGKELKEYIEFAIKYLEAKKTSKKVRIVWGKTLNIKLP